MTESASISLRPIGVIKELGSTIQVDEVDGEKVRDLIDVNFAAGGNPGRYDYIPKLHIWIEARQSQKDKAATIVRELIWYALMKVPGYDYIRAHDMAARWEKRFRDRVVSVGGEDLDPVRAAASFLVDHRLIR